MRVVSKSLITQYQLKDGTIKTVYKFNGKITKIMKDMPLISTEEEPAQPPPSPVSNLTMTIEEIVCDDTRSEYGIYMSCNDTDSESDSDSEYSDYPIGTVVLDEKEAFESDLEDMPNCFYESDDEDYVKTYNIQQGIISSDNIMAKYSKQVKILKDFNAQKLDGVKERSEYIFKHFEDDNIENRPGKKFITDKETKKKKANPVLGSNYVKNFIIYYTNKLSASEMESSKWVDLAFAGMKKAYTELATLDRYYAQIRTAINERGTSFKPLYKYSRDLGLDKDKIVLIKRQAKRNDEANDNQKVLQFKEDIEDKVKEYINDERWEYRMIATLMCIGSRQSEFLHLNKFSKAKPDNDFPGADMVRIDDIAKKREDSKNYGERPLLFIKYPQFKENVEYIRKMAQEYVESNGHDSYVDNRGQLIPGIQATLQRAVNKIYKYKADAGVKFTVKDTRKVYANVALHFYKRPNQSEPKFIQKILLHGDESLQPASHYNTMYISYENEKKTPEVQVFEHNKINDQLITEVKALRNEVQTIKATRQIKEKKDEVNKQEKAKEKERKRLERESRQKRRKPGQMTDVEKDDLWDLVDEYFKMKQDELNDMSRRIVLDGSERITRQNIFEYAKQTFKPKPLHMTSVNIGKTLDEYDPGQVKRKAHKKLVEKHNDAYDDEEYKIKVAPKIKSVIV